LLVKRIFDILASVTGLLLLAPLFMLFGLAIRFESRGPIFFRQERVGRFGHIFKIHKFRTMTTNSERSGLQITVGEDKRITQLGSFLRRYKLDELPQLLDVLYGNMSLVGPRPEVPKYVEYYPIEARRIILSVRPGITDRASIEYKKESEILNTSKDPEKSYIEEIIPSKLTYYLEYVQNRSFAYDLRIIMDTLLAIWR